MTSDDPSLRELLKGALRESAPHEPGRDLPGLPSASPEPILEGLLAQIAPVYAADRDGNLRYCSLRFRQFLPQFFAQQGSFKTLVARVVDSAQEEILTDKVELDGRITIFRSRHRPLTNADGTVIGLVGIYADITALSAATRKSYDMENWFQDVVRSCVDWVWSTDRNYNLIFVSPGISDVVDLPAQTLTGRYILSLGEFDADDRASAQTRVDMSRHAPFRNRIFLMQGESGRTRRILLSGVPVFDEETGVFSGYRGTGTDITSKFDADEASARARDQITSAFNELRSRNDELRIALEKSKIAKDANHEFLATLSHELKTPLNSIIGFSDAAGHEVHGPLDTAYVEYFSNIHKAGTHLLTIINDVLESAGISTAEKPLQREAVAVDEALREAAALAGVESVGHQIDVSGLHPETDLAVLGERVRIRQILVNLIGNAIKFTPTGGRIGADVQRITDETVGITVWDTGIGIAPDDQPKVFKRFFRVEGAAAPSNGGGSGLGLTISRQLSRQMGGDLTLTSIPGQGSRFTLRLPAA